MRLLTRMVNGCVCFVRDAHLFLRDHIPTAFYLEMIHPSIIRTGDHDGVVFHCCKRSDRPIYLVIQQQPPHRQPRSLALDQPSVHSAQP